MAPLPADFLFYRIDYKTINPLPDIKRKLDRLKIPLSVFILQVVGFGFIIQNKHSLGKDILPITCHISWKGLLINPKNNKTTMAKNKLFLFSLDRPLA